MSRRCVFQSLLLALLLLLAPLSLQAAVGVRMPLPDLVRSSSLVVRGKVTQSVPFKDSATGKIMTRHTLQVAEVWKGKAGTAVTVVTLGGELEEVGQWVPGEAAFEPEQEVVVFLVAAGGNEFVVNAMAQGLFRVIQKEGKLLLVRDLSGIHFVGEKDPSVARPSNNQEEAMELEKLRALCRRDGK